MTNEAWASHCPVACCFGTLLLALLALAALLCWLAGWLLGCLGRLADCWLGRGEGGPGWERSGSEWDRDWGLIGRPPNEPRGRSTHAQEQEADCVRYITSYNDAVGARYRRDAANSAGQRRYPGGPAARQPTHRILNQQSTVISSCCLLPAGQAGPVSLAADDCSSSPHAHPRARPLRHPPSGTHRRRQGTAQHRASRKVPAISVEAGAAQLVG